MGCRSLPDAHTSAGLPWAPGNLYLYSLGTHSSYFIPLSPSQPLLSAAVYPLTSNSFFFKALLSFHLLWKVPWHSDPLGLAWPVLDVLLVPGALGLTLLMQCLGNSMTTSFFLWTRCPTQGMEFIWKCVWNSNEMRELSFDQHQPLKYLANLFSTKDIEA